MQKRSTVAEPLREAESKEEERVWRISWTVWKHWQIHQSSELPFCAASRRFQLMKFLVVTRRLFFSSFFLCEFACKKHENSILFNRSLTVWRALPHVSFGGKLRALWWFLTVIWAAKFQLFRDLSRGNGLIRRLTGLSQRECHFTSFS